MEHDGIEFRKSTFSNYDDCVEVGFGADGVRLVRDSKHQGGPVLRFNHAEWDAFLKGVHAGEFG